MEEGNNCFGATSAEPISLSPGDRANSRLARRLFLEGRFTVSSVTENNASPISRFHCQSLSTDALHR